ncbi:30S ribosomal protein S20, chloroplastic [Fagus crenata]
MATLSLSCFALPSKLRNLSLNGTSSSSNQSSWSSKFKSLSFSTNLSNNYVFSNGNLSMRTIQRPSRHFVACEAAPTKKADSAAKRARQSEKRRIYNKSRKSEVKTRMKTVLEALDVLKKKPDVATEEIVQVEKLIAEAYFVIDKAVKVGTLHRNTGARRKSRLAQRKKAVEIHHGWYTQPLL